LFWIFPLCAFCVGKDCGVGENHPESEEAVREIMCKLGSDTGVTLYKSRENGMKTVKVDSCIAPLVQMLNDYGIQTIACCCGHGKTSHSHIRIHPKNITMQKFNDEFSVGLQFPYRGEPK